MIIYITRNKKRKFAIDGQLFIDGQRVCDTAERLGNCIPAGTYEITCEKCAIAARNMPIIKTLTDCDPRNCRLCAKRSSRSILQPKCPKIKAGNGVYNIDDQSILVGTHYLPGILLDSRSTFLSLFERIRKSIERGNHILLIIE